MALLPGREIPADFHNGFLRFEVDDGHVLVVSGASEMRFPKGHAGEGDFLGSTGTHGCILVAGDRSRMPDEGLEWVEIRSLFGQVEDDLFWAVGRGNHLVHWDRVQRFCGACGGDLALKRTEWAKSCSACGQLYFPQISPAVIVSVVDGDRILLTRNRHYRTTAFTVLAGFVEPGESLEAAVHREVMEEVGLKVKHLAYFGSQPWPFPSSLMLAFTAELEGGELKADPDEILEAGWFQAEALPQIPGSASIARRLIDAFVQANRC